MRKIKGIGIIVSAGIVLALGGAIGISSCSSVQTITLDSSARYLQNAVNQSVTITALLDNKTDSKISLKSDDSTYTQLDGTTLKIKDGVVVSENKTITITAAHTNAKDQKLKIDLLKDKEKKLYFQCGNPQTTVGSSMKIYGSLNAIDYELDSNASRSLHVIVRNELDESWKIKTFSGQNMIQITPPNFAHDDIFPLQIKDTWNGVTSNLINFNVISKQEIYPVANNKYVTVDDKGDTVEHDYPNNINKLDLSTIKNYRKLYLGQSTDDEHPITQLYCQNCGLNELQVSLNTHLSTIWCSINNLETLEITNNHDLTDLQCFANHLQSLDTSNNEKLSWLECYSNPLRGLDLSNNKLLTGLDCSTDYIQNLDFSNNPNIRNLDIHNNDLDELNLSTNDKIVTLNCSKNDIQKLDLSNLFILKDLYCQQNQLSQLICPVGPTIIQLDCSYNQLTSLILDSGIKTLDCSYNYLTHLNTDKCSALVSLCCRHNSLTELNVPISIVGLQCDSNNLSQLDLSKCLDLESSTSSYGLLGTDGNELTQIKLPNWSEKKTFLCRALGEPFIQDSIIYKSNTTILEELPDGWIPTDYSLIL